jgi:hypothetical protein
VQGDYALCVEIANWDFLHVGHIENRGHKRDAHARPYQCESTIVLKGGRDYVLRQIERARGLIQQGLDKEVMELNKDYAFVIAGDKGAIMNFETIDGRTQFRLLQVTAFKQFFANKQVTVGRRLTSVAEYWMSHQQRRQFKGIEFAPVGGRKDYYNLWQGLSVTPKPGSCQKFLDHLKNNVAQGDQYKFNWIVGWFAQIFQQPMEKPGTSMALRGPQRAGKTIVGQIVGSLITAHYRLVADPRYVSGRFNSHMIGLLLLQTDEAFWAGDKRELGKLKDLVTGLEQPIEFKGKETFWVRNYIRLFATSNEDFVVPAGFDERRFVVFDVVKAVATDFDAMMKETPSI